MKLNNSCEVAAAERYQKEGWKIIDSGWPDFLLYRMNGGRLEVKFAEVKSKTALLRRNQEKVLSILSTLASTVVCRERDSRFQEKTIDPPAQDVYYHRTDTTDWEVCPYQSRCKELCSVQYHVCEPKG